MVADILKTLDGCRQQNRAIGFTLSNSERHSLILEVNEERAVIVALIEVATAGASRHGVVAGMDFLFAWRGFLWLFGTSRQY
jgi:hypothetical protein